MSAAINNRYEFVYLFDCENGNPNGDPDAGNTPRIDPETSHGLVTDVCLKRKIRNFVEIVKKQESPFRIYVREKAVLSTVRGEAYEQVETDAKADKIKLGRDFMCKNFFDVRTFGAVMSTKENNCGQVRGPVQLNFSRSIDPVMPLEFTITRMAVETEKEAQSQDGDNRTMGRKNLIPYGLFRAEGYISAHLAQDTGFSEDDLELLWASLINMFDHDHSAARGKMNARKLFVFKHDSALGNAPAHKLFDLIKVDAKEETGKPPRSFADYENGISVDKDNLPQGVELLEML
ncbi:type I-C CRISPR-associated protein Cas7/Csd2 [Dethiosulfatarculus sandiegensis]|uniref:CRISPR-associated protein Csh2 n=1 Tax=Dethiosulfatarculus sandiegensis TaxID=1429043 RepID=A0A0D2HKK1_9BACT|nr:type I-C CRISPR-associated protein Cas7/Csd2 [Dethiosulfatarculus sandiegensis]KIX11178.1 CRISPR-associated protein Csh2 [Dethiosulfatarculus sandiegensis]